MSTIHYHWLKALNYVVTIEKGCYISIVRAIVTTDVTYFNI